MMTRVKGKAKSFGRRRSQLASVSHSSITMAQRVCCAAMTPSNRRSQKRTDTKSNKRRYALDWCSCCACSVDCTCLSQREDTQIHARNYHVVNEGVHTHTHARVALNGKRKKKKERETLEDCTLIQCPNEGDAESLAAHSHAARTYKRRPRRPPFLLVLSVGVGVTSSAVQRRRP